MARPLSLPAHLPWVSSGERPPVANRDDGVTGPDGAAPDDFGPDAATVAEDFEGAGAEEAFEIAAGKVGRGGTEEGGADAEMTSEEIGKGDARGDEIATGAALREIDPGFLFD